MSGWIQPHPITVNDSTPHRLDVAHPAATTMVLGYLATCATIILTAILSISFFYLVAANRHWAYPKSEDHLPHCRGLAVFARYVRVVAKIRLPVYLMTTLYVAIGMVSVVACYGGWIILNVLPMVILGWLSLTLTIAVFGPTAVFPACILFASILTVYCTGRIWGLWMNDTYLAVLKKGCRKLVAAKWIVESLSIDFPEYESVGFEKIRGFEHIEDAICSFYTFGFGCIAVYDSVWPLCQYFPFVDHWLSNTGGADWRYWRIFNLADAFDKNGTRFYQEPAMLSYWVDLQSAELRAMHSFSSDLLARFTPFFSPAFGWMFLVWCAVLTIASGVHYVILALIILFAGGLLVHGGASFCCDVWRKLASVKRCVEAGDRDKSHVLTADAVAPEIPDSAPMDRLPVLASVALDGSCIVPSHESQGGVIDSQVIPAVKEESDAQGSVLCASKAPVPADAEKVEHFCACLIVFRNAWLFILAAHCPLVCGVWLPYSLVGLFLPERLQLPGLLLLLTAYVVCMYGFSVKFVRQMQCGMRSMCFVDDNGHRLGCKCIDRTAIICPERPAESYPTK
ncbi:uncharacterized protein LOC129582919 [Paramacrobiotus metropolitanus]|uniref:uncharacterized protein LOC129582919 n=1 Tax=Paramacrobiotus metropolitanus TaxID=2943436 RepID=UPI0024455F5E|nr:uncharacterized protein LOC129582919 [Paramacrobiotus metropolitanus]